MRARAIILILLPLAACVPAQDAADQIARQQARTFVDGEVARRFPGVDATPITDCVIDNASAQEILTIAGGVALGNTAGAGQTVTTILQRPQVLQCAANRYATGLLGG